MTKLGVAPRPSRWLTALAVAAVALDLRWQLGLAGNGPLQVELRLGAAYLLLAYAALFWVELAAGRPARWLRTRWAHGAQGTPRRGWRR